MKIELLFFEGCPNVPSARQLLERCLAEMGIESSVEEREGDYGSPTILVNGNDIMGAPYTKGRACRLDLPTREKLLRAIERAAARRK